MKGENVETQLGQKLTDAQLQQPLVTAIYQKQNKNPWKFPAQM